MEEQKTTEEQKENEYKQLLTYVKRIAKVDFFWLFLLDFDLGFILWNNPPLNLNTKIIDFAFATVLVSIIYSAFFFIPLLSKKKVYNDSVLRSGKVDRRALILMYACAIISQILIVINPPLRSHLLHPYLFLYFSVFFFELLLIVQTYYLSRGLVFAKTLLVLSVLIFQFVLFAKDSFAFGSSNSLFLLLASSILWAVTITFIEKSV